MKNKVLSMLFLVAGVSVYAQKDEVLLTINKEPVYTSEFRRIYEKNLDQISEEEKSVDKNLDLFVNYKLKLLAAKKLKLDTSRTYRNELKSYKKQLMVPYLQDEEFKKNLLKEAYDRTINEVRASHILIAFKDQKKVRDSASVLARINEVKKALDSGVPFENLARKYSDDPSAKFNGGDLGYFSAFRMVYPFEEAAYKTKVGEVSEPFKTRFGYHLLKVTGKRKSRGSFKAAHILLRDRGIHGKSKADSLYALLQKGASFSELAKKHSEDKPSAVNGGELPKFSSGKMVPTFENEVMSLKKEGDYSAPFKTRYGWHIVKLLKNYPVESFEKMKRTLENKMKTNSRGNLSTQKLISDLTKKYTIKKETKYVDILIKDRSFVFSKNELSETILAINNKKVLVSDFLEYIKGKKYLSIQALWSNFQKQEVLNYYKESLEELFPEYKYTLQEYKDGLLLFDLMKLKIWDKAQNDSEGLEAFFEKNKKNYKSEDLTKVRGEVINDYQNSIEKSWMAKLKANNKVKVNKKVLKKVKQSYNQ